MGRALQDPKLSFISGYCRSHSYRKYNLEYRIPQERDTHVQIYPSPLTTLLSSFRNIICDLKIIQYMGCATSTNRSRSWVDIPLGSFGSPTTPPWYRTPQAYSTLRPLWSVQS